MEIKDLDKLVQEQVNIAIYKFFMQHKLDIRKEVLEDIKRDIETGQIEKRVGESVSQQLDSMRWDVCKVFGDISEQMGEYKWHIASLQGKLELLTEKLCVNDKFEVSWDDEGWDRTTKNVDRMNKENSGE